MENFFLTPIAHRGLHKDGVPENSLTAFERAIFRGYAIETDLQMTKDGAIVLFHDDSLLRMTGKEGKLSSFTKEELLSLSLLGSGEKIPSLFELLTLAGTKTPLLLELKPSPFPTKVFLKRVFEELKDFKGRYAIQSFQPLYLLKYRSFDPSIPLGVLTEEGLPLENFSPPFRKLKRNVVSKMSLNRFLKPDFVSFSISNPPSSALKFKGLKFAYTVRSEEEQRYAQTLADNIIFEGFFPENASFSKV